MVLAFTILTQTFFNTLLALESLEENADSHNIIRFARSQIILEPDLEEFERGGEIETLNLGTVSWKASVEPTEVIHLFRVELSMEFRPTEGQPFEQRDSLYLLRPTWSDPMETTRILDDARQRIEQERRLTDAW
ncbi:MAG: hypothetical protein LR015_04240 [Verrucomicrobia bacterium]|nr:hypothetical protein [Verrucomicrobiota bacterium]